MTRLPLLFTSVATALAAFSYTSSAHALGPIDLEIGARVGYATNPDSSFQANPLGFGLGGRAGVSFFGIYGGISGMYYLGGSTPQGISLHTGMYGLEAGYTLPIRVVKIRPQLGVGNATTSVSGLGSSSNLYLEPGVLVFIPIGILFVGADVNALIFPGETATGATSSKTDVCLSLHGQVGLRF